MALRVPETNFWDHFLIQTSPQNPHLDTSGTRIGPWKVIFGHFAFVWYFYLIFPWARAIFSKRRPSEENAKNIIFFAEMAYTHVGTKYTKRPRGFENFLKLWCTLMNSEYIPSVKELLSKPTLLTKERSKMTNTQRWKVAGWRPLLSFWWVLSSKHCCLSLKTFSRYAFNLLASAWFGFIHQSGVNPIQRTIAALPHTTNYVNLVYRWDWFRIGCAWKGIFIQPQCFTATPFPKAQNICSKTNWKGPLQPSLMTWLQPHLHPSPTAPAIS